MTFRTEIEPLATRWAIDHRSRLFMMGSCFTDSVGERLRRDMFAVEANPLGTLYNPASIATALQRIIEGRPFGNNELFYHEGLYRSPLAHTSLCAPTPEATIGRLDNATEQARRFLERTDAAIFTLGTAYVYRDAESGDVVANCHKLPQSRFRREKLTVEQASEQLERIIDMLAEIRGEAKIIFTVSPIRHVADGLHGNQLSKSTLLLAVDNVVGRHSDKCLYFPSYEALVDDLRDYRFYAADMKHPSDVAVDYVYDLFARSFFSEATRSLARQARALDKRLSHRTLSSENNEINQQFNKQTIALAESLAQARPELAEAIYSRTITLRNHEV